MSTRILSYGSLAVLSFGVTLGAIASAHAADPGGRWYKGNTHTHTFWSDGNQFPEMAADWYKQHGYDFLALSDHNVLSEGEKWMTMSAILKRAHNPQIVDQYRARFDDDWVQTRPAQPNEAGDAEIEVRLRTLAEFRPLLESPGEFLLIQAEEISEFYETKPIHTNALNLEHAIPTQGGDSVRDVMRRHLRAVLEQEEQIGRPLLAHLNHPNYRWAVTAEDLAHVLEEEYFEVYNGHGGTHHFGDEHHPSVERIWDIANTIRVGELQAPPLFAVATDDTHSYHGKGSSQPGRGWIMVRAGELTPAALIEAMRRGDFYASSGVTLRDIRYDAASRTVTVEIDPVPGETYTTVFSGTRVGYDPTTAVPVDADGKPTDVTRTYSSDVGATFATRVGVTASYQLTGDELYVRATVSSDRAPENTHYTSHGHVKQAWTQPVGWHRHVENPDQYRVHDPLQ